LMSHGEFFLRARTTMSIIPLRLSKAMASEMPV
jgi:hypothetical protein